MRAMELRQTATAPAPPLTWAEMVEIKPRLALSGNHMERIIALRLP